MTALLSEEEVKAALDDWYRAFDQPDIEALIANGYGFENGFGFRSVTPRMLQSDADARALWESFYGDMEYYAIAIEDLQIELAGDVAVAWGFHTERFQRCNQPAESLRVRFSFTLQKLPSGDVRIILAHRDVQEFDPDGRYTARYT